MNSYVTFHNLWIHIWIHVYEEYRGIIPEIMCTKIPDVPGPGPKFQVPTESRAAGGLNRAASKAARESRGHKKNIKIFVVQILYRLVRPAHSALHAGNSRCFLLGSNSYFLIQLKFNLSEKICSRNQTENLFDVDGSYFDQIDFDEMDSSRSRWINFSIHVRKTGKWQIKCFEYITSHKIMY